MAQKAKVVGATQFSKKYHPDGHMNLCTVFLCICIKPSNVNIFVAHSKKTLRFIVEAITLVSHFIRRTC